MKVYIVTGTVDYEGDQILGVFASEELAANEVDVLENSDNWSYDCYGYDEWDVK